MLAPVMPLKRRTLRVRFLAGLGVASLFLLCLLFRPIDLSYFSIASSRTAGGPTRLAGSKWRFSGDESPSPSPTPDHAALSPVVPEINSTLGFGRIYAVSGRKSPRRQGLLRAANVTELDITVPEQPEWSNEVQKSFRLRYDSELRRGSLLAWLGHLHALTEFLTTNAETALFIEDDVDWDIRLRTEQIPRLASAMRALHATPADENPARYPYGNPKEWDLLYVGHCGDYLQLHPEHGGRVTPEDLRRRPYAAYIDPTMLPRGDLHPWTAQLLDDVGVADPAARVLHRSAYPLCTFGYAATRAAALRLATELADRERRGQTAYDVAVMHACGSEGGLRCWTVTPELMHHAPGSSLISTIDRHAIRMPVDEAGADVVARRGEAINIACGFWDGAFDFSDGDVARLAWLRTEVVRKGVCQKDKNRRGPPNTWAREDGDEQGEVEEEKKARGQDGEGVG